MTITEDPSIDELGPVDYLVVEFPAGAQNFTGEMADELLRLADTGIIRILDLLVIVKDEDGGIDAFEIDEATGRDDVRALEAHVAEILAADDVVNLAAAMAPGSVAGVIVWENSWAAPFASAARALGRPAGRHRTHSDPGHRRLVRGRAGRALRGRCLTCRSVPHAPPESASSALLLPAPLPSSARPRSSATASTGARTAATTVATAVADPVRGRRRRAGSPTSRSRARHVALQQEVIARGDAGTVRHR